MFFKRNGFKELVVISTIVVAMFTLAVVNLEQQILTLKKENKAQVEFINERINNLEKGR